MKNKNTEYSRQKYGIIESSGTHPDKIYPISNSQSDIGKTLLSDFMSAMGGADRNHPVGFDLNVETLEAIKNFVIESKSRLMSCLELVNLIL